MLNYLICFLLGILLYIYYNINERFNIGAGPPQNVFLFKLPNKHTDLTKILHNNRITNKAPIKKTFIDFVDSLGAENAVAKIGWEAAAPINMVYKFRSQYYFVSQYDQLDVKIENALNTERQRNNRVNVFSKGRDYEIRILNTQFWNLTGGLYPPYPVKNDLDWLRHMVKYLNASRDAAAGVIVDSAQRDAETKCAFKQCRATMPTGTLGMPPSGKAPKPCSMNGKVSLTKASKAEIMAEANKNLGPGPIAKAKLAKEVEIAEQKAKEKAISEEKARNDFLQEMRGGSTAASAAGAKVKEDNRIKEGDLIAWIGIDAHELNHRGNGAVVVPAEPGILPMSIQLPQFLIIRRVGEQPPDWIPGATVRGPDGHQNLPGFFFIIRNNEIIGIGGTAPPSSHDQSPYLSYLAPCLNRYYPLGYGRARDIFMGDTGNIWNMLHIITQLSSQGLKKQAIPYQ